LIVFISPPFQGGAGGGAGSQRGWIVFRNIYSPQVV